jgi:mannose-1-phosphate guanylyltransferase
MKLEGAYWRDIGTPGEYRAATEDVLSGRVELLGSQRNGPAPDTQLGAGVRMDDTVRIGARVTIGNRAAIVGPTVIGEGVYVDEGATVQRSIVWAGARIGAYAIVRDSIVGEGYVVPAGAALDGRIVANEPAAAS